MGANAADVIKCLTKHNVHIDPRSTEEQTIYFIVDSQTVATIRENKEPTMLDLLGTASVIDKDRENAIKRFKKHMQS